MLPLGAVTVMSDGVESPRTVVADRSDVFDEATVSVDAEGDDLAAVGRSSFICEPVKAGSGT